jgi:hypothetical protein
MMVNLVSVPHTGTKFLRKLLIDHGIDFTMTHYFEFQGGVTVSPIRDPLKCYNTFMRRQRPISQFYDSWHRFNEFYETQDYPIIPVDVKTHRTKALKKLSERLGVPLRTDWKPVGTSKNLDFPEIKAVDIDLSEIYALPVVKQYYTQ